MVCSNSFAVLTWSSCRNVLIFSSGLHNLEIDVEALMFEVGRDKDLNADLVAIKQGVGLADKPAKPE